MSDPTIIRVQGGIRLKIPQEIADELQLKAGDFLRIEVQGNKMIMTLGEFRERV